MLNAIRATLLSVGTLVVMTSPHDGLGLPGHRIVGAIADMVMSAHIQRPMVR